MAGEENGGLSMPLNPKGQKIKMAMMKHYGAEKGEDVFYASENKGTITGVKKGGPTRSLKSRLTR